MNLELAFPPGVARNGTELQQRGRWYDSHLVRWHEGAIRPWGGWVSLAGGLAGAARAAHAWTDNSSLKWLAVGTHSKLYVMNQSGDPHDITPAGYAVGSADAVVGGGYGSGDYQEDVYSGFGADPGAVSDCTVWTLDSFGQYLVGCNADDGRLYKWTLNPATPAAVIAGAPTSCRGLVVTGEGVIMALGAGGDPRVVQWCDIRDDSNWTPGLPSIAGSFPLQTPGRLMCGRRIRGGTLLFTHIDVHLATFNDPSNPFSFERVGADCGVISQGAAVAASDDRCVWMGPDGFFVFEGGVRAIPCEVSDYVFGDLNRVQASKITAVHNAAFAEVTWFYPSAASGENDRYVTWNYQANHWTIGRLARTCGVAKGVFANPIMVDPAGHVWNHESGLDYAAAAAPFLECGPVMLGAGDRVFTALHLIPDERALGGVQAEFFGRLLPTAPEQTFGPYPAASQTSIRFTARQVRMRLTGAAATDWRAGDFFLSIRVGGSR